MDGRGGATVRSFPRLFRPTRQVNPIREAGAAFHAEQAFEVIDVLEEAFWDAVTHGTASAAPPLGVSAGQSIRIRKAALERNMMRTLLMHELEAQNDLDALRQELATSYAARGSTTLMALQASMDEQVPGSTVKQEGDGGNER